MDKFRLDLLLLKKGLVSSRARAQSLIKNNQVLINNMVCNDISKKFNFDIEIKILNNLKYVSRAGYKLEEIILKNKIKLENKICLDIGSSTGGFSDFLLQNKVKKVVAVDVGNFQFDQKLLEIYSNKIELFEKTDIRDFNYKEKFDIIVCDVSFISLEKIIFKLKDFSKKGTELFILLKPQFEVGKIYLNKKGIVKKDFDYNILINKYKNLFIKDGFEIKDILKLNIKGGDGNQEFFFYLKV